MKRILLTLSIILIAITLHARTAEQFFADAPEGIFPLLNKTSRMDMVDYHQYGMTNGTTNYLGSSSRIVESNDRSVLIQAGETSSIQVAVLPQKSDTIIAVIETVLTPQADSGIRFYRSSNWSQIIPRNNAPGNADFIPKGTTDVPMAFIQIRYNTETDTFVFTNTTAGYFTEQDRPEAFSKMPTKIECRFDGKKWKPIKQ